MSEHLARSCTNQMSGCCRIPYIFLEIIAISRFLRRFLMFTLKSISKVWSDEKTCATSHTCDECFNSEYFTNESHQSPGYNYARKCLIKARGTGEK